MKSAADVVVTLKSHLLLIRVDAYRYMARTEFFYDVFGC